MSILEHLLSNRRKAVKLIKVLEHFKWRIATSAEIKDKSRPWIVADN